MELKLSKNETNAFIELLYLGNWIANSIKSPYNKIEKYESLFCKINEQFFTEGKKFDEEELYNKLSKIIEFYDGGILYSVLAKHYADYKCPTDSSKFNKENDADLLQYISNGVIRDVCENELKSNGFKNIYIELPNLNEKIEEKFNIIKSQ